MVKRKIYSILIASLLFFVPCLSSCGNSSSHHDDATPAQEAAFFAVTSDTHIYDAALGTSGDAYVIAQKTDRTLMEESSAIFTHMSDLLIHSSPRPQFMLIPGDLTRDGELSSHLLMVEHLHALEAAGIEVFVVPGNHDIENPDASRYTQAGREYVESISASDFAAMYAPFGYQQAIARDPHSLSYVAEPVSGYWLFGIDSCRYAENDTYPIVGGKINENTLKWLKEHLALARENGKQVLAMMHHLLNEHAIGLGEYLPDFMLGDWRNVGQQLADEGLNLVFTGHFHAQKITRRDLPNGGFIVDVQTGSPSAWPNPYRVVNLDAVTREMVIETRYIESLPAFDYLENPADFEQFSREFSNASIDAIFEQVAAAMFGLTAQQTEQFAPLLREAINAFFYGDQKMSVSTLATIAKLTSSGDMGEVAMGAVLFTLWQDLPPQDNDLTHVLERQLQEEK